MTCPTKYDKNIEYQMVPPTIYKEEEEDATSKK
jgi:hypothetical protein